MEHVKTNTSIIGNMDVMGGQEEEAHLCSLARVSHLASPGHWRDGHNIIIVVIFLNTDKGLTASILRRLKSKMIIKYGLLCLAPVFLMQPTPLSFLNTNGK